MSVCRGTCFLDEKLKQADEQQRQSPAPAIALTVFFMPQVWEAYFTAPELPSVSFSLFQEKLSALLSADLFFHPPRS